MSQTFRTIERRHALRLDHYTTAPRSSDLGFHAIHGPGVALEQGDRRAVRTASRGRLAFSNRPILLSETVVISVESLDLKKDEGRLHFGLMTIDPAHLNPEIPDVGLLRQINNRIAREKEEGYDQFCWFKELPVLDVSQGDDVEFVVSPNGSVNYTINDTNGGELFRGALTDLARPLWVVVDVGNGVRAIDIAIREARPLPRQHAVPTTVPSVAPVEAPKSPSTLSDCCEEPPKTQYPTSTYTPRPTYSGYYYRRRRGCCYSCFAVVREVCRCLCCPLRCICNVFCR